jgi:hypothetical protein
MFKDLLNDKMETIANLGDGISEILKSNIVSEITKHNKPFDCDISPDEIGLNELKVDSPIYLYKNKRQQCVLRKINLKRTFELSKEFNSLNQEEKTLILNELIPILKKQFTHIYKIIEKRDSFIVAGYVNNHIDYICYGNKVGY